MAENIEFSTTQDRKILYREIIPQISSLVKDETDLIANLANIAAVLKESFGFFWVGFYLVKENQLVLGPFQGPLACTRIDFGKGVCGNCAEKGETLIVKNVHEFQGHIACDSRSNSEIVVPVFDSNGKLAAVLDVDSTEIGTFDEDDKIGLEAICKTLLI